MSNFPRITVLVVDDEPMVLDLICLFLRGTEFDVLQAGTLDEAARIRKSRTGEIGIILTDLQMPGAVLFPAGGRAPQIDLEPKVIYMTGFAESHLSRFGVSSGAMVLFKPFRQSDLLTTLRRAASGRSASTRGMA